MTSSPDQHSSVSAAPQRALAFSNRLACQPVFGVKRKLWRRDDDHAHTTGQEFAPIRDKVLRRDNYSCRYCGFKAAKFQEVHHLDDNHGNNDPANLLTVCNLCHQVHHLGMSGMRNAGLVTAIPELTQSEVHHIARAYFVAQLLDNQNVRDRLTGLYSLMLARADVLKTAFNMDISSPLLLAEILSNCDDALYAQRDAIVGPLRLLPTKEAFHSGQLEYYAANLSNQFGPENWAALARQLMGT